MSDEQPFSPGRLNLGLGLLSIGRVWGVGQVEPPPDHEAQDLLLRAVELGIRVFDTAPAYAASEARLGRFLNQVGPARRQNLVVMTKAGEHWDSDRGASFVDHRRDALCRSIDRSLELLGRIDVLQIHKATRGVVRDPAVMAALDHARASGITTFGASVSDLEAGSAAIETGVYQALQFPLNVASQTFAPLLPTLKGGGSRRNRQPALRYGRASRHLCRRWRRGQGRLPLHRGACPRRRGADRDRQCGPLSGKRGGIPE